MRNKGIIIILLLIVLIIFILSAILIIYIVYNLCFSPITEKDIVGKWVYKYNLPQKSGIKDINESIIEFNNDMKFTMVNFPFDYGNPSGKIDVLTGSGIWKMSKDEEGQESVVLIFQEIEDKFKIRDDLKNYFFNLIIDRGLLSRNSLFYEAYGSKVIMFDKINKNR